MYAPHNWLCMVFSDMPKKIWKVISELTVSVRAAEHSCSSTLHYILVVKVHYFLCWTSSDLCCIMKTVLEMIRLYHYYSASPFERSSVTPCSLHLIDEIWKFASKMLHCIIWYKYWCCEDPCLWKWWQKIPVHKSLVRVCRTALLCIPEHSKLHHLWCESLKSVTNTTKLKPSLSTVVWTNQLV
jgi:hypothetical protein